MANHSMKTTALGLIAACAFVGGAQAGGFSRGEADTDILYEDGTIAGRGGVVYVMPDRAFATVRGANGTDDAYSENYAIPSFAAKFRATDNFSCAFTYTQPFGAKSEYGQQARLADLTSDALAGRTTNAVNSSEFETNELGGTCAVNFDLGPGDVFILGGVFSQSFDYSESKTLGTLDLEDTSAFGYRLGAAYEIKEYALRGEIMYRSQVDHEASGFFTIENATFAGSLGVPVGTRFSSTGTGSLPQSLEVSLQSGIAPDWLAFGSIKWTDWSVLQTLNYSITNLPDQQKNFFWRDGWTVTGGVGHQFNEKISGALSLTWDRGVGTGADIFSDTWTLGAGAQIKHGPGVLRIGAAASYLTSGEQSTADGADFNATADGDWAYALSANYRISF